MYAIDFWLIFIYVSGLIVVYLSGRHRGRENTIMETAIAALLPILATFALTMSFHWHMGVQIATFIGLEGLLVFPVVIHNIRERRKIGL